MKTCVMKMKKNTDINKSIDCLILMHPDCRIAGRVMWANFGHADLFWTRGSYN